MALAHLSMDTQSVTARYLLEPNMLDLTPPYQRTSVWSPAQRVNLIQSVFMGLPIGAIVLNFRGYATETTYAVIDGAQRLRTLMAFAADQFAVPATWFEPGDVTETTTDEHLDEPGVLFSALSRPVQRTFEDFSVAALKARVEGLAAEAQLYLLLNSSGTAHTDADLDKARAYAA